MSNPFLSNVQNNCTLNNIDSLNQLMQNPMFQALRQRGFTPEQMVRYVCQQRGINADDFIKQLKSNNK